ncbi:hypothetical protein GALL_438680 [mine drainage metagenome]|uniref:Uncharacterized protein n=1 Tax=mine drainage metagenome TaxID=410659 RepID=A0A1J5PTL3_9ZZZZ
MQTELHQFAAANKLIDQLLETMLVRAGGASRVRLNVIHNGVTGLTGTGLLRYDVTNSVAAPGRLAGAAVTNQPLSDWSDFLPALLAGHIDCGGSTRYESAMAGRGTRVTFEGYFNLRPGFAGALPAALEPAAAGFVESIVSTVIPRNLARAVIAAGELIAAERRGAGDPLLPDGTARDQPSR